jgi:hypothetical protein
MKQIRIIVRCANDPGKHAKVIRVAEQFGMEWAEVFAELLDGTSPMYIYAPGELSPIGKCATCGGKLSSEVKEVDVDG